MDKKLLKRFKEDIEYDICKAELYEKLATRRLLTNPTDISAGSLQKDSKGKQKFFKEVLNLINEEL